MPDDPRDRKLPSSPFGVPIGRPITERGNKSSKPSRDSRDFRSPRLPPEKIRAELGHDRAPIFAEEEFTDQYDGEQLKAARATREPEDRISRLEEKHDMLLEKHDEFRTDIAARVNKVELAVADMGGQFKVIPRLVDAMEKATSSLQQRAHVTFTAEVDVAKEQALSEIEVAKTVDTSEAEIRKSKAEIQKAKWQLLLKIAAVLGAIGTAVATAIAAGNC